MVANIMKTENAQKATAAMVLFSFAQLLAISAIASFIVVFLKFALTGAEGPVLGLATGGAAAGGGVDAVARVGALAISLSETV